MLFGFLELPHALFDLVRRLLNVVVYPVQNCALKSEGRGRKGARGTLGGEGLFI